jgi:hypothetical protein
MTARVVVIDPDGRVRAVYSDKLPLRSLGPLSVERASSVEFDTVRQVWRATEVGTGRVLAEGPSRDAVIAREVETLEEHL